MIRWIPCVLGSPRGEPRLRRLGWSLLLLLVSAIAWRAAPADSGVETRYQYDARGQLTTLSNAAQQTERFVWDALGRLQTHTNPLNQAITYGYDPTDAPIRVQTPNGAVTTWSNDGFGQPRTEASPDRGATAYTYDPAGNLTRHTDARGVRTETAYDALNRPLEQRIYRPDQTLDATHRYQWDRPPYGIGRLDRIETGLNVLRFDYDPEGRVLARSYERTPLILTLQSTYDSVTGRRTTQTYPKGSQLQFQYDSIGRLTSLTWDGTVIASGLQYTADRRLTTVQLANGLEHRRSYDTAGRISRYTLAGEPTDVHYDAAGQIDTLTPLEPTRTQRFNYDAAGRLTTYQDPNRTESYTYDANGNRQHAITNGQPTAYQYLPNSNRLQTLNAITLSHDPAGNRLTDLTRHYTYDSAGRLTQLQSGITLARYEYNGVGERVFKQIGPTLRHFVYDEQGHLLGEYDASGQALAEYAWLGDLPIAYRTYRQVNGLTQIDLYAIETDHLGTPRVLTDATRQVRWRWHSAPFGQTLPDENPHALGTVTFNLRFPGQYYDAESGLHYNYYRDYDPQTGRYVQSDPIGLWGGVNTYVYVENDPLGWIDQNGLTPTVLPWVEPIIRPIPMPIDPVTPLPVPDIEYIPGGPHKDPFGEECRSLARRINNTRDEIYNKRYPDLESNPQNLPGRKGPGEKLEETIRGHEKLLNRRLRELRELEDEYGRKCVPMACL